MPWVEEIPVLPALGNQDQFIHAILRSSTNLSYERKQCVTQQYTPETIESTMEKLLSLLVYEWQLSRTSPMGKPLGGVETHGNETSITLSPHNV